MQGALRSLWVSHARRRPQLSCLVRTVNANARGPGFGRGARYSGRLLGKWSEQAPSSLICHCQLGCRGFANEKCLNTYFFLSRSKNKNEQKLSKHTFH